MVDGGLGVAVTLAREDAEWLLGVLEAERDEEDGERGKSQGTPDGYWHAGECAIRADRAERIIQQIRAAGEHAPAPVDADSPVQQQSELCACGHELSAHYEHCGGYGGCSLLRCPCTGYRPAAPVQQGEGEPAPYGPTGPHPEDERWTQGPPHEHGPDWPRRLEEALEKAPHCARVVHDAIMCGDPEAPSTPQGATYAVEKLLRALVRDVLGEEDVPEHQQHRWDGRGACFECGDEWGPNDANAPCPGRAAAPPSPAPPTPVQGDAQREEDAAFLDGWARHNEAQMRSAADFAAAAAARGDSELAESCREDEATYREGAATCRRIAVALRSPQPQQGDAQRKCEGECKGAGFLPVGDEDEYPCATCGGSGVMPTVEEIGELREAMARARADLEVAQREVAAFEAQAQRHGLPDPMDEPPVNDCPDCLPFGTCSTCGHNADSPASPVQGERERALESVRTARAALNEGNEGTVWLMLDEIDAALSPSTPSQGAASLTPSGFMGPREPGEPS